ncbi:phospholipase, patatin family protein [Cardiosporidium cionae]|uniref:Phospholipase, patatin family protein n=1 Tax=Cardiosporidium cionae TaxID=476202 RepID=A0ABQ7J776_9APIC|nr:phospholipase, patatin family protein [Cardiosporidium cionae]|eukprot:KAF8819842.1 phospholipase, patatin family protein [Cardiosporidium cionae]
MVFQKESGAALALYHFGVCDVLLKESPDRVSSLPHKTKTEGNLLPRIICGTSAGAAVAAWLCTRTNEEIREELRTDFLCKVFRGFSPNNWLWRFWNILKRGYIIHKKFYMCDVEVWEDSVFELYGDLTFLEAYQRTGRILNISLTRADRYEPALVLNYKNAPHVVIYSAVLASLSFPFLGLPFHLKEKLPAKSDDPENSSFTIVDSHEFEAAYFHDGSLRGDVPVGSLKDIWGTKFTIVSQVKAMSRRDMWQILNMVNVGNVALWRDAETGGGRDKEIGYVNPHVFPFCGLRAHGEAGIPINWRGRNGQWRAGFLLSGLELFFKENMRFLLRLIALLDLSPTCRGINCGSLALQSYIGDVTVHPSGLTFKHLKLANDPSQEDVEWYLRGGRQMTFPKLSFIVNRVRIDRALERLFKLLSSSESPPIASPHSVT